MNTIKRWYVSLFFTAMFLGAAFSVWKIVDSNDWLGWLGLFLTTAPGALFISTVFLGNVARTDRHLTIVQIPVWIGVAIAWAGQPLGPAAWLGEAALVANLLYIYWYSSLERPQSNAIVEGEPLPTIELETPSGEVVSNADWLGRPTLLMFYRGNWCPLCMAQIREIAGLYKELDRRGVRVAMVSPQSHSNTEGLAAKFDVPFEFLVDRDNRVANRLEIVHKGSVPIGMLGYDNDAPFPTVLILDAEGKVAFADMTDNYRVRPEPDVFLKIIDEKGLAPA